MDTSLFETRLAAAWPPADWCDVTVLAAVSGGADSVALLRGLAAIRGAGLGRIIVAHFNHRLRGAESDGDAAFVAELCGTLTLPCESGRAPADEWLAADQREAPEESAQSLASGTSPSEESLREQRYNFLVQTARRVGARYIVTAHTADDQAETILHRIVRGTGLAGLAGIARAREIDSGIALFRPLLNFRRAELRAYLAGIGQAFREDSSNAKPDYTRNRIRHELLPQLAEQFNPRVAEALLRLGGLAAEQHALLEQLARRLLDDSLVQRSSPELCFNANLLAAAPRPVVRQMLVAVWTQQNWPLQAMTHDHWLDLAELACGQPADVTAAHKRSYPGDICAELNSGRFTLRRAAGRS